LYLKHLLSHRGLTAHDKRTGGVLFMAEAIALEYIALGQIQVLGSKSCVRELRWVGTPLPNITTMEEAAGYKPSQARPTKYSHNRDTPDNPQNVWTLKRLPNSTARIYRRVQTDCLSPFRP
jgi:hypothetical protein